MLAASGRTSRYAPAGCSSEEYDIAGKDPRYQPQNHATTSELLETGEKSVAMARKALAATSDEHLMKNWKLKFGGQLASEDPRWMAIANGAFTHMTHHRGQLTVYLRLLGAKVPATYGPSADEQA